jgi:hypothetical protein
MLCVSTGRPPRTRGPPSRRRKFIAALRNRNLVSADLQRMVSNAIIILHASGRTDKEDIAALSLVDRPRLVCFVT